MEVNSPLRQTFHACTLRQKEETKYLSWEAADMLQLSPMVSGELKEAEGT